jgi:hypothetical protein
MSSVLFESGTRLREIGPGAFALCDKLETFNIPEPIEILGDRSFEFCSKVETILFEGSSILRTIGELAFAGCNLNSITISALREETNGSVFLNCPLITVQVAPGSLNFKVERNLLITSGGTEIVKCIGLNREIVIRKKVRMFGKSCFESCKRLDQIDFEFGSDVERIDAAALRDCDSLVNIEIHACVRVVEEASFEGYSELGSCLMDENSLLITIGAAAFAKSISLMSFCLRRLVGAIGSNCFNECLHQNC